MILLNFSHPLTREQLDGIRPLLGGAEMEVWDVPTQLDPQQPFVPQVVALADACGLSSMEWQTTPLLVNPPGYAPGAVALMAELHGRMGHFPAVLRLRPVAGSVPPRYEVAEVLNLQVIRDEARTRRHHEG